ncbi:MAG: hypothetical protein JNN01_05235 [Opitutaceae bacterium]|nr:hypothetical protein [Opitutaceae bacterium]
MEPNLLPFLFPIFFVGVIGVVVVVSRSAAGRAERNLRTLASRLGLQVTEHPPVFGIFARSPTVEGVRRGKPVRLYTFTTGSGKSRKTWAAVAVQASRRTLTFSFEPQGVGSKIMEFFGVKEVTVGDRPFDEAWFVRTNLPDYLRAALIPELRERLMEARRAGLRSGFRCENGEVRYAERGGFSDDGKVARFLVAADLCSDLAEVVEVAGPDDLRPNSRR